ncbi:MAG: hypothetical protein V3V89_01635, partial [Gammaproteobacteria bacterium]
MSKDKKDQVLEEYLGGNTGISRQYHAEASAQPAKHLDETILAASRKAVTAKPRLAYSPFSSNWYVPASVAAVVVLCVGLVFNAYQQDGQSLLTSPSSVDALDTPQSTVISEDSIVLPAITVEQDAAGRSFKKPQVRGGKFDTVTAPIPKSAPAETPAPMKMEKRMIWQRETENEEYKMKAQQEKFRAKPRRLLRSEETFYDELEASDAAAIQAQPEEGLRSKKSRLDSD